MHCRIRKNILFLKPSSSQTASLRVLEPCVTGVRKELDLEGSEVMSGGGTKLCPINIADRESKCGLSAVVLNTAMWVPPPATHCLGCSPDSTDSQDS